MKEQKIKLVHKKNSKLMRLIGWLTKSFNPTFMDEYTTTIGRTIYLPSKWDNWSKVKQIVILCHEKTHINQYKKCRLWFVLSYLFLPLPMFFSYFRCKYEAEAYTINIKHGVSIDDVVEELHGPRYLYAGYGFGKKRLKKWIEKELKGSSVPSNK